MRFFFKREAVGLRYIRLVLKFESLNVLILRLTQMYERETFFIFRISMFDEKCVCSIVCVRQKPASCSRGRCNFKNSLFNRRQQQRKCGFLLRSSYQVNTVRGCFQQFHYSQETSGCFVFSKSRCENRFKKMRQHL